MMCLISPAMVLCLCVTLPWRCVYPLHGQNPSALCQAQRGYGKMNGYVGRCSPGRKPSLAYAYERMSVRDFSAINHEAADAYRDADALGMTTGPTINMINNPGAVPHRHGGSRPVPAGRRGHGADFVLVLYSRKFCGPINEIANIINEIYSALAAAGAGFYPAGSAGGAGGCAPARRCSRTWRGRGGPSCRALATRRARPCCTI